MHPPGRQGERERVRGRENFTHAYFQLLKCNSRRHDSPSYTHTHARSHTHARAHTHTPHHTHGDAHTHTHTHTHTHNSGHAYHSSQWELCNEDMA